MIKSSAGVEIGLLLPVSDDWIVPTIVQLDLAKWASRELDKDKANQIIAFRITCKVGDLTSEIA